MNKYDKVVEEMLYGGSTSEPDDNDIVEKENDQAFLKALNFNAFFQMFPGKGIVKVLQEQTNAFEFEKNLLLKCKSNRLTKVSMILDEGEKE